MPSDTFHRLRPEKKQRIFQAAVEEFARCRFSDASINKIVKAAGIPRGSFYQYFENKEDLYLHVLQEISKEKLDILSRFTEDDRELSFFEALEEALPAILAWADERKDFYMIGLRMVQDDSEFMRDILGKMSLSVNAVREIFRREKEKGKLRADADPDIVTELLQAVSSGLLRSYFLSGDKAGAADKVKKYCDIIFRGVKNDASKATNQKP